MQNYIFQFLEVKFPQLADMGKNIEEIFYQDPHAVLIKGRVFSEVLLNEVANQHDDLEDVGYLKLFERIQYLEKEGILDNKIARSFDTIRYLGNKGSHNYIEYDLEDAFKMHKRLFEVATWFMEVYGDYSFAAPNYTSPKPKSGAEIANELEGKITSKFNKKFARFLEETKAIAAASVEAPSIESEIENNNQVKDTVDTADGEPDNKYTFDFTLEKGESYLLKELSKLKESSQQAIENSNTFSIFKDYLHVERSIQNNLKEALDTAVSKKESQLVLLCGSVGDGKSHLLAYMKNKYPELVSQFSIHNDATESFDPHKSSLDTLAEVLEPFNDENIHTSTNNLILAINLGVLHNFIESSYAKEKFVILTTFIEKCNVFEATTVTENQESNHFNLISFSDYQPFELADKGASSHYYSSLLERIVRNSETNPFYCGYIKDKENGVFSFFTENYELLMLEGIRECIVNLLIKTIIKQKSIISTRALLNFIHDILVPADTSINYFNADAIQKTENLLPNLIFNGGDRSPLLSIISKLDPIHMRSSVLDQILVELNNTSDIKKTFEKYIELSSIENWEREINNLGAFHDLSKSSRQLFNKTLIRFALFLSKEYKEIFIDHTYQEYLSYLYHYNVGNKSGIKGISVLLKQSVFHWNGKLKDNYVYVDKTNSHIQVAQSLEISPYFAHLKKNERESLNRFSLTLILAYGDKNKNNPIFLEIDYPLYEMMIKLSRGYRPNKKDKEDSIQFVEFVDKLMKLGNRDNELLFIDTQANISFKLNFDKDYDEFTFRRE